MLNRLTSNSHRLRETIQAALHGFENSLVLPARNSSLFTGCAFSLDCAILAVRTPVTMQVQLSLFGGVAPDQTLTCRATIRVILRIMNEVVLAEASVRLGA